MRTMCFFLGLTLLFAEQSFAAVDGTTGTPLGGVGTGCIKFCANNGTFQTVEITPPAMKDFQLLSNANFQLYTNRGGSIQTQSPLTAVVTNGRASDDALFPIDTAYMGVTNNIIVSLTAFSPICFDSVNLMSLPYAFFEFTLTNTAATAVDAAVAFQIPTGSVPVWVAGKGIQSTDANALNRAVYATSSTAGAVISAGSDNGFLTTGQCNNVPSGTTNKVVVKVNLAAQTTGTIKFVYAWYNGATLTYPGNNPWTGAALTYSIGPDRLNYTNLSTDAGSVADVGLTQFDRLRTNALSIASRMRASSLPDWIKDQTLNSLCNITSNTIFTKDGRHCFTEGQWNTNGTMDQMWHAREIMIMTVPDLAWKELEWWARTQKTDTAAGQIHHDMGAPTEWLWGWDSDANHPEYAYQPDCNPWVDLNVGFIISVYEAYIATGNKTKLDYFWPYVKLAGQRILKQVKTYGNTTYPYTFQTSLNTYDQPGLDLNPFNSSLSSVAYKILNELATIYGDNALKTTYQNALDTSKISFEKRYLTNNFPTATGRFTESILAGQWAAFYLKFGQLYSQTALDYGLSMQDSYYQPLSKGLGFTTITYEEWAPYLVSHYGGLRLQTGRTDLWRALQFDWYERNYLDRNLVFNQPLSIPTKVTSPTYLATSASVYNQYISVPVLWRNYYTIIGYHRNKPTGELWLEPILPAEVNHVMQDAFYMAPEGNGTISATETGNNYQSSLIIFKPDNPVVVSSIYVLDKSTDSVAVTVNGVKQSVTRLGTGYAKELKIAWSGTVTSAGITIVVAYGKDIVTGVKNSRITIPQLAGVEKTFKCSGDRIIIPEAYRGKEKMVSVYTLSGVRICTSMIKGDVVNLRRDFGIPHGTYIVKVCIK